MNAKVERNVKQERLQRVRNAEGHLQLCPADQIRRSNWSRQVDGARMV